MFLGYDYKTAPTILIFTFFFIILVSSAQIVVTKVSVQRSNPIDCLARTEFTTWNFAALNNTQIHRLCADVATPLTPLQKRQHIANNNSHIAIIAMRQKQPCNTNSNNSNSNDSGGSNIGLRLWVSPFKWSTTQTTGADVVAAYSLLLCAYRSLITIYCWLFAACCFQLTATRPEQWVSFWAGLWDPISVVIVLSSKNALQVKFFVYRVFLVHSYSCFIYFFYFFFSLLLFI